jgi:hypothetical protein
MLGDLVFIVFGVAPITFAALRAYAQSTAKNQNKEGLLSGFLKDRTGRSQWVSFSKCLPNSSGSDGRNNSILPIHATFRLQVSVNGQSILMIDCRFWVKRRPPASPISFRLRVCNLKESRHSNAHQNSSIGVGN